MLTLQEWQCLVIDGTIEAIRAQGELPSNSCEVRCGKILLSAPALAVAVCWGKTLATSSLVTLRKRLAANPDNDGLVFHEARACRVPNSAGNSNGDQILTDQMIEALMRCNNSLPRENRVAKVIEFLENLKREICPLQTA